MATASWGQAADLLVVDAGELGCRATTEVEPEPVLVNKAKSVADEIGLRLPTPRASLIGVDHLFEPDVLVEVEATALLD